MEKIKRKKQIVSLEAEVPLRKANSLPKELVSLTDIEFDFKFENSLFRNKSETYLKETIIDPVFTSFVNEKQKIISASIKSDKSEIQSPV